MSASGSRFLERSFDRFGQHLAIAPETLREIGGDFVIPKLVAATEECEGYRVIKVGESLLADPDGRRIANAGCELALRYRAFQSGIRLFPSCQSTQITRLPDPQSLDQRLYPDLPHFVQQNERGLVRIPKSFNQAELIRELAVAFPEQRMTVVSSRTAPLEKLRQSLSQLLPAEYLAQRNLVVAHSHCRLSTIDDEALPKLILCTFTETADLDFSQSDIVIFLDAIECTHERARLMLEQPDLRFRLFGLIGHGHRPSPNQAGLLAATFGFEILDLNSAGGVRREVNVAWVTHRRAQAPTANLPLNLRHAYIENPHRNDRITRLAKTLYRAEPGAQSDAEDVTEWLQTHRKSPLSITILVDQVEHALLLSRRLPGWPIYGGKSANLQGLPGSVRRQIQRGPRQWLDGRRQIVLTDAVREFRCGYSDIIIWAGGGSSCEYLPRPWLFEEASETRGPLLLIDFVDSFHSEALSRSLRRREAYAESDIFPVGMSSTVGRVRRFIQDFGVQFP